VEITSSPGETFLDRMIALVEGASRQKTPNEIALDILIAGMTLILLVAVVTLQPMAVYDKAIQSTVVLVALFVCLARRSAHRTTERHLRVGAIIVGRAPLRELRGVSQFWTMPRVRVYTARRTVRAGAS